MTSHAAAPTAGRCRAKNPATCRNHGRPVNAETFAAEFAAQRLKSVSAGKRGPLTRALRATLAYRGPKPSWWDTYGTHLNTISKVPVHAEILDVVDTPAGRAAVVWADSSEREHDQHLTERSGIGIDACYYKHFETGETLGYVQLSSVNQKTIRYAFGDDEITPFRWEERFGKSYGLRYAEREGGALEHATADQKMVYLWVQGRRANGEGLDMPNGEHVYAYDITASHAPDMETVKKDLKRYARQINRRMKADGKYYATPYVDFSRVHEPLLGHGHGSALYIYAARRLAQRGQVLRGSGLQSDEAQAVWARFAEKLPRRVKSVTLNYRGREETYQTLDFR